MNNKNVYYCSFNEWDWMKLDFNEDLIECIIRNVQWFASGTVNKWTVCESDACAIETYWNLQVEFYESKLINNIFQYNYV